MNRFVVPLLFVVPLVIVVMASHAQADASPANRPNILFIYADDQSYRTVGCYPESWPWVRTPNIDTLARNGVRFQGAYLGAWCMPSRASILTGRHPHGIESMRMEGTYPGSTYDPKQCPFWFADLRRHGYHTAHIGKWHTGTDAGFGRDWDHQIVWNRPKHPNNASAYYETQTLAIDGVEKQVTGYPADNYTDWACEYVRGEKRDPKKPWLLWLCYGSVHGPSKPADRHKGRYKDAAIPLPADIVGPWAGRPGYWNDTASWRKLPDGSIVAGKNGEKVGDEAGSKGTTYADWVRRVNECVPAIDEGVGKLLKVLKETGQLEKTIIIYTADQGFAMGEHGMRMKIAPYDANFRSPLIIQWPGVAVAGKTCPQSVNAPDLVATLMTAVGMAVPAGHHGRDIAPLMKKADADWPYPCLYEHTGHDFGSDVGKLLAKSPEKAIYQKVPWYTAIVHDRWKYVCYLQPGVGEELFDLRTDPTEAKNVAADPTRADRLKLMRTAMIAELKRTQADPSMIAAIPKQ